MEVIYNQRLECKPVRCELTVFDFDIWSNDDVWSDAAVLADLSARML